MKPPDFQRDAEAMWQAWIAERASSAPPAGFVDRAMARALRPPVACAPVRAAFASAAALAGVCFVLGLLRLMLGAVLFLVCVA